MRLAEGIVDFNQHCANLIDLMGTATTHPKTNRVEHVAEHARETVKINFDLIFSIIGGDAVFNEYLAHPRER